MLTRAQACLLLLARFAIADEVLGGWGLLREWRQLEGTGAGGGSL